MNEIKTISKQQPDQLSLAFDKLREMGLKRIQTLSSGIWTDYNTHDPGITTLEALCYAITDLGYRLTFDMQDLLANNPNASDADVDFKNFFTARQILHNAPVTIKDFRKLLMDVTLETDSETIGIKNAWIMPAADAEVKLFVDKLQEKLSYSPTSTDGTGFFIKGLYNFLFEFDQSLVHGDLHSNSLTGKYIVTDFSEPLLNGVEIKVTIHFPRWDDLAIDFTQDSEIKSKIKSLKVEFDEVPTGFSIKDSRIENDKVILEGSKNVAGVPVAIDGLNALSSKVNKFIFEDEEGILQSYKRRIAVIKKIIQKAEQRLQDNRPLCEDYLNVKALRVEEIAICGDIEIDPFANPAEVAAQIYYEISKFLSPEVYFYSLPAMKQKGKTTEEIFDGPALMHGFIDDDELDLSAQKCNVRVSDLIQIIMDVEIDGKKPVRSVSGLQLANFPEDNDGTITQKSVKWCLSLAIDKLYVPRLSTTLSNLSFYKNGLPFSFDEDDMDAKFLKLSSASRKRFPANPILDSALPVGNWRETNDYTSIQEDFPLVYGVGSNGIPNLPVDENERAERITSAKQFKGFLSFFDQLLYNYLNQVNGLKSLFSLNQQLNEFGEPLLNKTYFSEPLTSTALLKGIVPNAFEQEIFGDGYKTHLQNVTETPEAFEKRKNRFLDHLLARFCEQFSDYALIAYTLDGQKAGLELIKDKLAFLNGYPEISSNRGKSFNYKKELNWFHQNVSGYEKRVAMLLGIDAKNTENLFFSPNFKLVQSGSEWNYETKIGAKVYFKSQTPFATKGEALEALEKLISAGSIASNYQHYLSHTTNKYSVSIFQDVVGQAILSVSKSSALGLIAANNLIAEHVTLCQKELYNQVLSNRKNLGPPIDNYIEVLAHTVDESVHPHLHKIKFQVFDQPVHHEARKVLLKGDLEGAEISGINNIETLEFTKAATLWKFVRYAADEDYYRLLPDSTNIYEANYHFEIVDIYNNTQAKHQGKNYNRPLAELIEDATNASITITDSLTNNGTYSVSNTVATGANIKIEINETFHGNYPDGKVNFTQKFSAYVNPNGRNITIAGIDLTNTLRVEDEMFLVLPSTALLTFKILSIKFLDDKTEIVTSVPVDFFENPQVGYAKQFTIKSITPKTVTIRAGMEMVAITDMVAFFKKVFIEREGLHLIEHTLLRPKTTLSDQLLNIHTDADCEQCKITDTYSFVMTAVLPYWPERFRDRNFRTFIEKTLREECPAHITLNVCWVSPQQMDLFEKAYKKWLILSNTLENNQADRVLALQNFITVIQSLRSVYPSGKLHSCEDGDTQKNTLILNQTNIGTF